MPVLSAAQLLRLIIQDATISVGVGLSSAQLLPPIAQEAALHVDPERSISTDQVLTPMTQTVRIQLRGGYAVAEPRPERAEAQPRAEASAALARQAVGNR